MGNMNTMARRREPRYAREDFTDFLRTRECAVLAAGELNTQIEKRVFIEDKLAKIFILDRKRKPASFDGTNMHRDISAYLSMCGAMYRAATWLQTKKH